MQVKVEFKLTPHAAAIIEFEQSPAGIALAVKAQDRANEKRKAAIITELYKTGRINGLYFDKSSRSLVNPIKHYIKGGLFKKRVADQELVEDCYQELFIHLQEMKAAKFCKIFDESPNKLIATALRIVSLKCFAIDPRHGNPKHSFIESILFASVEGGASRIDRGEHSQFDGNGRLGATTCEPGHEAKLSDAIVLESDDNELCEFERAYGFTPEQAIERLTPQQRADFYEALGKQPKGRQSKDKIERRAALTRSLLKIKQSLSMSCEIS